MIKPKVGQVWENKVHKTREVILKIENNVVHSDKSARPVENLIEFFSFNKEETIKHLKEQQEQINKDLAELSKPEIVKHKFEVVINAPTDFDSNRILKSIEYATSAYWKENLIESYYVDVIKE